MPTLKYSGDLKYFKKHDKCLVFLSSIDANGRKQISSTKGHLMKRDFDEAAINFSECPRLANGGNMILSKNETLTRVTAISDCQLVKICKCSKAGLMHKKTNA